MPQLSLLERPKWSRGRLIGMYALRIYLVVAGSCCFWSRPCSWDCTKKPESKRSSPGGLGQVPELPPIRSLPEAHL